MPSLLKFKKGQWLHNIFLGVICGSYPLLFYYSNNYSSINSVDHIQYFLLVFIGIPVAVFLILELFFCVFPKYQPYKNQVRFVAILIVTGCLLSQAAYLKMMKKMLTVLLFVALFLARKKGNEYRKLLVLIGIMAMGPLLKNVIHIYEHNFKVSWMETPTDIKGLQLLHKPNIYVLQPDGYVAQNVLEGKYYNSSSDIYSWLGKKGFKVYPNFRSNYPASLTSNASMFAMQQHYFGNSMLPTLESSKTRDVIQGKNPLIAVLKANGYHTSFIGQCEYFLQNRAVKAYHHYHIPYDTIPYFSNDERIKNDVTTDFKKAFDIEVKPNQPRFFFVERVLPHHVHFLKTENRIEADRLEYLENLEKSNNWIKETINYIKQNDTNALIVLLADHGGWAGNDGFEEMYSTKDPIKINSIFSTLAAIDWHGLDNEQFDTNLVSNVNVFRVLLAVLSENKKLLDNLEDDSSYNLRSGLLSNSVVKVIDDQGNVVYLPHNN